MEKNFLLEHFKKHPKMQIQDLFKFIYQSAFGCEHAVSSLETAIERIKEEYDGQPQNGVVEHLDGDYCRVGLSCGMTAQTLGKLFFLSAKKTSSPEILHEKIQPARDLISKGELPFESEQFENELKDWEQKGCPAVHHSEIFRQEYKPSYRVISNDFIPFLPLFAELDARLLKGRVTVAIEGGSASGKTTLSQLLESVYDCTVFHADDFFLRPEQRTPERFNEVGGNLDRERLQSEVLIPLKEGKTVEYRKFDCSTMTLCEAEKVTPKKLVVVEGTYSMHPELEGFYDLTVLLSISEDLQKKRILKRNPQLAPRFFNEWIPLEKRYFSEMKIKEKCDVVIEVKR